jgi:hypothetical protein
MAVCCGKGGMFEWRDAYLRMNDAISRAVEPFHKRQRVGIGVADVVAMALHACCAVGAVVGTWRGERKQRAH